MQTNFTTEMVICFNTNHDVCYLARLGGEGPVTGHIGAVSAKRAFVELGPATTLTSSQASGLAPLAQAVLDDELPG